MSAGTPRPVIFPLSNPVSRSEARPQDLEIWSDGRAIIGTGSPFPPVIRDGKSVVVDQTNNAYVFPGVGLGVVAVGARRVSDGMFKAAARALADVSPAVRDKAANLLPPVNDLPQVAVAVATAVARAARNEGLCQPLSDEDVARRIAAKIWKPEYRPYRLRRRG